MSDEDLFQSPKLSSTDSMIHPINQSVDPPAYTTIFNNIIGQDARPDTVHDTLEESISETFKRDWDVIFGRLKTVLSAGQFNTDNNQEWDLWGPLLFSLILAISLSLRTKHASSYVFELSFLLIWLGSVIIYCNSRLLGHKAGLMQTICFLGYSVFPLSFVALLGFLVPFAFINFILVTCALVWSVSGT